jgi:hypothetical protein
MPEPPKHDPKLVVDPSKLPTMLNTTTVPLRPDDPPSPECKTFMGQDGRTYYKYKVDGQELVTVKPLEQMTEQDFYDLPIAAYEAQAGRIPNNLTVEFVDPQMAGYWVNCHYNNGMRVVDARTRGFVPAKREDLKFVCTGLDDTDGAVKQAGGDLILMKISKAKLFMRYKEWMDIARLRGGVDHYKSVASNAVNPKYFSFDIAKQAQREFQGLGPVQQMQEFQQER